MTPAQSLGVSRGDNRLNSSGGNIGNTRSRGSQVINNIVAANQTLPVPANGTQFYLLASSNSVDIRPSGGAFVTYSPGTGLQIDALDNAFNLLEIRNTTGQPIAFSIFVGFQDFIDKRLIVATNVTPAVAFPTYPVANAATSVAINDLSGTAFTDINGNQWYAVSRVAIIVCNPDGGVTLNLQKAGGTGGSTPAVAVIYPLTSLRYDASGNYSLSVGGGNVNAIVSEIYLSLPKV